MKGLYQGVVWVAAAAVLTGCLGGGTAPRADSVEATGRLRAAQVTSFMYGTHLLVDAGGELAFALRSGGPSLEEHEGQWVRVLGTRVEGYPVDGGPVFLEVRSIKRITPPAGAES